MSVPLVFLHGWAMNGAVFDDVIARLGPGFSCHAPDLPGHGARAGETPSLARCVEVIEGEIQRLERPVVIGWSMGAAVIWRRIAQRGAGDLGGLVTIDMSPCLLPGPDWPYGLKGQNVAQIRATSAKIEPRWAEMTGSILRGIFSPYTSPATSSDTSIITEADTEPGHDFKALKALLLGQDPAKLRPLWDDLVAMDARKTMAAIKTPYLVCAGADSQLYDPAVATWIATQAPKAEAVTFEKAGHAPHLEQPDAFCRALTHFVSARCLHEENQQKTQVT